jgi:putative tricarboxylic transport membrane protein
VTRLRAGVPYAAVFAAALYLYHGTAAFAAMGREGQLSPAFWPRAVLGLLMAVCAWEVARAAWFPRDAREGSVAAAATEEALGEPPRQPLRLAAGIALTAAYVPAMQALGFFIATAIYLAAFMVAGRYRRPFVVAIASIGGSLAFVFVFMKVVYVSLPLGMGPFRAFSASLLAALGIH